MSFNIVIKSQLLPNICRRYSMSQSPAVHRSSWSMEYICIYRVVSSPDLLCHWCSWSSLLCRSIWSTMFSTWNPVKLSSTGTLDPGKSCGEGTTRPTCVCALVVLIPALDELEQHVLGGWQFVHCSILLAKQSLLASLTQLGGLVLS